MKKLIDSIKNQPVEWALFLILAVQIVLHIYSNIALTDKNIDCDSAMLMKHIVRMWEEKTPVIPGWSYITTMEWDCTTVFALPLYGLTYNIFLACALSNVIFLLLFIAALFFLFRGQRPVYPLLCANLIGIPYRTGQLDYYNMLFFSGAQYVVKVMIPILLAGILCCFESYEGKTEKKPKSFRFFLAVYLFFLLISCMSSGVYVAVCGVLPVWLVYFGYKFFRWERVRAGIAALCGVSAACLLVGFRFNMAVMQGTRAGSMVLCSVYQMLYNVSSCFFGIFELMGGVTQEEGVGVFSLAGIGRLSKSCLVALILICGLIALRGCIKKQGDLRMLLLLSVPLWNYFILNVSYVRAGSPTYEYRYHLMGMVPLICLAVIVLTDGLQKLDGPLQAWLFGIGAAGVLTVCALSFGALFTQEDQQRDLKELCAYCAQADIGTVYIFGDFTDSSDAEVCRVLDLDREYLYLTDQGVTWVFDYDSHFIGEPLQGGNAVVAVSDLKFDLGDAFTLAGRTLIKFDTVANRSLYYVAD